FSILVQNLGSNYSVENLLANNTIYPYFAPFITAERQRKVFEDVHLNGQGLHGRLGISGGRISRKQGLYYCSMCANMILKHMENHIFTANINFKVLIIVHTMN